MIKAFFFYYYKKLWFKLKKLYIYFDFYPIVKIFKPVKFYWH